MNTKVSRYRQLPTSFITFFTIGFCFYAGWLYARLKQDEFMRRIFFARYFNCMTLFDQGSTAGEYYTWLMIKAFQAYDSAFVTWKLKRTSWAKLRARWLLRDEI